MSDQPKEVEFVVGVIDSVNRKKEDTWIIVVKPDGSQYTKNLWTKNADGVAAAEKLLGERRYFTCNASYWKNQDGKEVRSLWVERMTAEEPEDFVGGSPAPKSGGGSRQRSPEETRSIIRQSCLKAAAAAYQGREVDGDITNYVIGAAERYEAWVLREDAPKASEPELPDAEPIPEEFRDIPF